MTFTFVLQSVLIVLAIMEIIAINYPHLQKQIFAVAFLFTCVWCTAKYAYGPDICTYIPYYRLTSTDIGYNLTHSIHGYKYEKGFVVFCTLCKIADLSFWQMTAVISIIYFTALGLLMHKLDKFRTLALLVLVFFDNNIFLVELRQCLAVSFFIFGIMAFNNKKYLLSLISALIMLSMHKTAAIVIVFTAIFYLSRGLQIEGKSYLLLAAVMMGFIMIPLAPIMNSLIDIIPMPASYASSAKHHLIVGKSFQKVLIVYLFTIFVLAWYKRPSDSHKAQHWMMWGSVAVLAFLFPYWFLLNRFRSYFLPFLIIYTINTICNQDIKEALPRQIYTTVILAYIILSTALISTTNSTLHYPTDRISLVFERINHSEEELTERQMKQAIKYWEYDYTELIESGQSK